MAKYIVNRAAGPFKGQRGRFTNWIFWACILPKKVKYHWQTYQYFCLLFEHLCVSDVQK